jgi:hypothetical protein
MAEPTRAQSTATGPRPPPPVDAAAAPDPAEQAAWAEVLARWGEPAAHQAYLARFPDLDGLTTAGRRYREVLATRPGDQTALAMKGEVLKRATVVGLAMLPRTPPSRAATGKWKRIALLLLTAWLGIALATIIWKIFTGSPP